MQERRASRGGGGGGGGVSKGGKRHEDDPRDMDAHVLIEYHVPPSKVRVGGGRGVVLE